MSLLNQTNFPRLWLLMQKCIGGNAAKQALATENYKGQRRVLEIGCSVGNISQAFTGYPDISFTGIDIDENAIHYARKRFRDVVNFRFETISLEMLAEAGERFDYVLFAGILHHVDDATGEKLMRDAIRCTAANGTLAIYEPEAVRANDSWFFRLFYALFEQGKFLRSRSALEALVARAGIEIERIEDRMVSLGIVRKPYVARFNLLIGRHVGESCS